MKENVKVGRKKESEILLRNGVLMREENESMEIVKEGIEKRVYKEEKKKRII